MRHRLRSEARRHNYPRFLQEEELRVDPLLIEQLVHHPYTTHVSELSFLLEQAVRRKSYGDVLLPIANETNRPGRCGWMGPGTVQLHHDRNLSETQPEAPDPAAVGTAYRERALTAADSMSAESARGPARVRCRDRWKGGEGRCAAVDHAASAQPTDTAQWSAGGALQRSTRVDL